MTTNHKKEIFLENPILTKIESTTIDVLENIQVTVGLTTKHGPRQAHIARFIHAYS